MTHEIILKMIEEADPTDTAKLDEIDLLFWKWLSNHEDYEGEIYWSFETDIDYSSAGYEILPSGQPYQKVSRSRDALKAIRPKSKYGWEVQMIGNVFDVDGFRFILGIYDSGHQKTEELAELHAIIQAIAHERANLSPTS